MKNKNKNGFTLIELLAVIIILIIVIFIAITKVRNSSLKAQLDAMKASAGAYIKAINNTASNVNIQEESPLESGLLRYSVLSSLDVNVTGTKPSDGYVIMSDYEVTDACFEYGDYFVSFNGSEVGNPTEGTCGIDSLQKEFAYTGSVQEFTVEKPGKYKIELWGAEGANYNTSIAGKGAYTSGVIDLNQDDVLYIYVGGTANLKTGGFNGGANGGTTTDGTYYGGGGSTDVRLVSGSTWNDSESLASRIMVAAGGAGAGYYQGNINGGSGGTLTGVSGTQSGPGASHTVATGGTQTSAGFTINGAQSASGFGFASQNHTYGTGAGSGYYGGGSGSATSSKVSGGAGGSSYISGYTGCVAITSESDISPKSGCDNGTTNNACSIHYSGKKFTDAVMKAGNEEMPTYDGSSTMIGNASSGFAKITLIG